MPQRYRVLALDFDGTLARNNVVAPETIAELEQFKASGVGPARCASTASISSTKWCATTGPPSMTQRLTG